MLNMKTHVSQMTNAFSLPDMVSLKAKPSPLQLITVKEPTEEHKQMYTKTFCLPYAGPK